MTEVWSYPYYGRPEPPTIFGEAPGPSAGDPLAGCIRRIARLFAFDVTGYEETGEITVVQDVDEQELRELFEWRNLLDEWPGYGASGGSKFPMEAARKRAYKATVENPGGVRVYLGRRVADAFGFQADWLVWCGHEVVCPHPSGLSRWWNDSENQKRAHAFWQELVDERRKVVRQPAR